MEWIIVGICFISAWVSAQTYRLHKSLLVFGELFVHILMGLAYTYWQLFDVELFARVLTGRLIFISLLVTFLVRLIYINTYTTGGGK